jgi:hypothetical protein
MFAIEIRRALPELGLTKLEQRRFTVTKEPSALTASLVLVNSLSASVQNKSTTLDARCLSDINIHSRQTACEADPGDNRGKGRQDSDARVTTCCHRPRRIRICRQ